MLRQLWLYESRLATHLLLLLLTLAQQVWRIHHVAK